MRLGAGQIDSGNQQTCGGSGNHRRGPPELPVPGQRLFIDSGQQLRPRRRIVQKVAQRLLAGQSVEQFLIVERGFKERVAALRA